MELLSEFILRKSSEIKEFDSLKADNTFLSHLNSIIDIWYYIKENVWNVKEPYIYYEGDSRFALEWENINIYISPNGHFDYTYKNYSGTIKNYSGTIDVYNCKIPCSELLFAFKQQIAFEQQNRSILQKIKDCWVGMWKHF